MIDVMTKLLAGEDNEDDIKRYARLVSLYWEKKNIYVCKMKKKNTYKILFGKEK